MEQQLSTKDLESQLLEYINKNPVSFEQKQDDMSFEMSTAGLKSAFSKPIILMGLGSASSGLLAGTLASVIPVNLQFFAGLPTIVAGLLGKILIKNNSAKSFFDGVLIAGISQTVSRFIPASFGQTIEKVKGGFSQTVQQEFKQESKPCDDIRTMRPDVAW